MDCNQVKIYLSSFDDNENDPSHTFSDDFYIDLNGHIESCPTCKVEYGIDKETLNLMSDLYDSIDASNDLKISISEKISKVKYVPFYLKTALAASVIFLLGFGFALSNIFLQEPKLQEIHNHSSYDCISNDLDEVIRHAELELESQHIDKIKSANFTPEGSTKIKRPFKSTIRSITFKNNLGHRLSLCFVPLTHNLIHDDITNINGLDIFHGMSGGHNFAFWNHGNNRAVLISDSLLPHELVELAPTTLD